MNPQFTSRFCFVITVVTLCACSTPRRDYG